MADVRFMRGPVEYIYLDRPGIDSIYAQIVESTETGRVTSVQRGTDVKARAGVRLKNLLLKMVGGLEGDVSAEVSGSKMRTEQSTTVQATEQRLRQILTFLGKERYLFTNLPDATRHVQETNEPTFISFQDKFNAPQFYGNGVGVDTVNAEGYLRLERGMDYNDRDDYYKQSTALLKVSASIKKMAEGPVMAVTSHAAIFLRGFRGRGVPLWIFGNLSHTSDYYQIKPFAIWK
jgi:hypothetical protein